MIGGFSTAAMSLGKAMSMIAEGKKARTKRFLDKEGQPTNEPNVLKDEGTLIFMGGDTDGHKGFILSLWIESLIAMAGASANNPQKPNLQSFVLIGLDPDGFAGRDYFRAEIERFLAHVTSSRVRGGFGRIRIPGEQGFRRLRGCRKKAIPLDDAKAQILRNLAEESAIKSPV
jgi:LDH2 family malate/lactate/ureidoglycolate dehydrogenase